MNTLFAEGLHSAYLSSARGTLIQDKWYQGLLPMLNPELEMVQVLAPDAQVDHILQLIIDKAQLYRSGSGVVYSTPCDDLYALGEFPLWPIDTPENPAEDATLHLRENLTAIHYINQGERTESVCRAAINAGAHGPIVQYSRGFGLRDRLGWLRITNKPTKEVVSVLVDSVEADFIFSAMAEAAQVDRPGRGVMYRMPVQKGMINMDSVYSRARHTATMQQVIRAIDELKGGIDWRDQEVMGTRAPSGIKHARYNPPLASQANALSRLSVITDRINSLQVSRYLLKNGVLGVNMNYLQLHKALDGKDEKQHRDLAHIRTILDTDQAVSMQKDLVAQMAYDAVVYTQPVGHSLSYKAQAKVSNASSRVYRGGRL